MASKYRQTEQGLAEQLAKYKALAQPALRDQALAKLFDAARKAAIAALPTLDPEELSALEATAGGKIADLLPKAIQLNFGEEKLILFVEAKPPKKKK